MDFLERNKASSSERLFPWFWELKSDWRRGKMQKTKSKIIKRAQKKNKGEMDFDM